MRKKKRAAEKLEKAEAGEEEEEEVAPPTKKKKKKKVAVDGVADAVSDEGGDLEDLLGEGPVDDKFSVSEKYAKKFNEKKDKIEAARAARILADEDIASDSSEESTEDEDAELLTGKVENKIFETLSKIKAKDPSIYDSKTSFFNDGDFEAEKTPKASSQEKKMTYKSFLRDTLMKEGADAITREEEEMEGMKKGKNAKTPAQEQRDLQDEIRAAAAKLDVDGDEDDDGDLFALKEEDPEEKAKRDEDFAKFQARADKQRRGDNAEEVMSKYWRADEDLEENERFLRDYIMNRQWLETESLQTGGKARSLDEDDDEDEEEEEHLEEADEFEKEYNFRFEVEEGKQIQGHARFPEASVREKNDKRKRQRKEKAERKEAEKVRRTEELKRLKNLKKQEIKRRLEQIREVTGNQDTGLEVGDLDEEYNPDDHDKAMAKILGDDYDEQEEALDSKELVRDPEGCDVLDTSKAATEGLQKHWNVGYSEEVDGEEEDWQGNAEAEVEDEQEEEEEHDPELWFLCDGCQKPIPGGKWRYDCTVRENYTLCAKCFRIRRHPHKFVRKRVPKSCMPPEDFKAIQAEAEEGAGFSIDDYFQLDYEDIIGGDLPTRFKYRKVEAKDYGIPANVILAKSGKELNQMVSLKKLRTYRDENVGDEDDAWAHSRKGRGKGKGQGKSKGRGRGQEPARQGKKKGNGSEAAQGSELSAARLEAYNLQGDKFAREKHWQKKGKKKAKGNEGARDG
eukprot:TRINITY_DN5792_c0_g1_i2.p1 TRINITY_DN5792_c0_g1~~TRINITY_DN5792_c0_g1_i2.p1  ORF type:complete len:737 (+),score=280.64 TRINITY_DN5792_c0_g1_i2:62-2272(+)